MYKFYATLLDAYQYFLHSDSDTAMHDFLNKINRVPFESEAADRGTAFNELVDLMLHDEKALDLLWGDQDGDLKYSTNLRGGETKVYFFKKSIVSEFVNRLMGSTSQVYTSAKIQTSKGEVLLYGYIDEILKNDVTDIKTTGRYEFPKFLTHWQHRVYPYCLSENGIYIETFTYRITDFNGYFEEVYAFNKEKAKSELIMICENLIDFIEMNRDKITDLKIFGKE